MRGFPRHIGIIPDGNRRLARRLMKRPWKGHEWGLEKIKDVLSWSREFGIGEVTVYVLSLENIGSRPKREIDYLYDVARKELEDILGNPENEINSNKIRVNFFGKTEVLPKDLQELINNVSEKTAAYKEYILNLAMAYGGRQEIIDAARRLARDVKAGKMSAEDIHEDRFRSYLWSGGLRDPELIIRTGGEKRVSNFLPFQGVYSELHFSDRMWPEFGKEDFGKAVREFAERDRRFGK